MATVAPSNSQMDAFPYPLVIWTWTPLTSANTDGDAITFAKQPGTDRSVQVSGVMGGATVTISGSHDNVTYFTLHDPLGNVLTFANATGFKQIAEISAYTKVTSSGGGGTTAVTVIIAARQGKV